MYIWHVKCTLLHASSPCSYLVLFFQSNDLLVWCPGTRRYSCAVILYHQVVAEAISGSTLKVSIPDDHQKCALCGVRSLWHWYFTSTTRPQVIASVWQGRCLISLVHWLSRGFGSSGRRPHSVSSLVTSGSGISGLPQSSLPRLHPMESPTARAFYSGGSASPRVSDSSRPLRLGLYP